MKINKINLYYEISSEAKLCKDEQGNFHSAFMLFTMNLKEPIEESELNMSYEDQANSMKEEIAKKMNIPTDWLTTITAEEYDMVTDE